MRLPALEMLDGQPLSEISEDLNFALPVLAHSMWPGVSRFQHVIRPLYPSTIQIRNVQTLPGHARSLYILELSNGSELLVKFGPLLGAPLLRRERSSLETEALALDLLRQTGSSFIPRFICYAPEDTLLGAGYLLTQHIKGSSLLDNVHRLSAQTRRDIYQDLGGLVKAIGQCVSTDFGPLTKVAAGLGSSTWRQSFILLFEEVLRDAEDLFVHLPYNQVREQLCRFAPTLDEIKVPRLTIINFGRPSDVLLDYDLKRLSGIMDLSSAIWGDVLLAEVFEEPPEALLKGYGSIPAGGPSQSIRSLLYSCYRHVYRITELHYRNRTNDVTEIHARRKLTDALQQLSTTEAV